MGPQICANMRVLAMISISVEYFRCAYHIAYNLVRSVIEFFVCLICAHAARNEDVEGSKNSLAGFSVPADAKPIFQGWLYHCFNVARDGGLSGFKLASTFPESFKHTGLF